MARLTHPYRRTIVTLGGLTAVAGWVGTWQLVAGVATPPDHDLPPFLDSWVLPGVWLAATVAVPWSVAALLEWRRSDLAPVAVLVACTTLAVELAVQIPFIGLSVLQLVFVLVAVALGEMAQETRRAFGPEPRHPGALPDAGAPGRR